MAAAPHVQITFKVRAGERTGVWSQGARASGESVHGPMSLGEQVRRTVDDVHVYHEGGEDVVVDAELEPGAERGSQGGRRGVRRLSARLTKDKSNTRCRAFFDADTLEQVPGNWKNLDEGGELTGHYAACFKRHVPDPRLPGGFLHRFLCLCFGVGT